MSENETKPTGERAEPNRCCHLTNGKLCGQPAVMSFVGSSDSFSPSHEPGDLKHYRCLHHIGSLSKEEFKSKRPDLVKSVEFLNTPVNAW